MPNRATRRRLQRGGKRLDGERVTAQLKRAQCHNLIDATVRASDAGQPFNRWITLLWEKGGIAARDNVKATGRFVKLASDWARQHGYRLIWAWVQEWGPVNLAHVHLLLYVPPELNWQFQNMPLRWVKQILPGRYVTGVLDSRRPDKTLGHRRWLWGKVHYMLKCAPAELEGQLGMTGLGPKPWGQQCQTFGRRLSIWQGWHSLK